MLVPSRYLIKLLVILVVILSVFVCVNIWLKYTIYRDVGKYFGATVDFIPDVACDDSRDLFVVKKGVEYVFPEYRLQLDEAYQEVSKGHVYAQESFRLRMTDSIPIKFERIEYLYSKDFLNCDSVPTSKAIRLWSNPLRSWKLKADLLTKCMAIGVGAKDGCLHFLEDRIALIFRIENANAYNIMIIDKSDRRLFCAVLEGEDHDGVQLHAEALRVVYGFSWKRDKRGH